MLEQSFEYTNFMILTLFFIIYILPQATETFFL